MKRRIISHLASLILVVAFFTANGCTKTDTGIKVDPPGTRTYLALGDSYTIGESVAESDRFPAQTVALLKNKGITVGTPEYIARTGWTTIDLQNAIKAGAKRSAYDIVTLLIGVNDQYQGMDTAGYRTRFSQLLETAVSLAGEQATHVFVLSIPDYSVTPFGGGSKKIQAEVDAFNRINRQVTAAREITYVDITPVSRQAGSDQSFTANDGLHPSAKQYAQWAQLLSISIETVLK